MATTTRAETLAEIADILVERIVMVLASGRITHEADQTTLRLAGEALRRLHTETVRLRSYQA